MTSAAIKDASPKAIALLRERCKALGMPTWRCDNAGVILSEPDETGPTGLLLGSGPFTRLISQAAARWGQQEDPDIAELFPGCWAIPLVEVRRRNRAGCIAALAMSPAATREEMFLAACGAAHLDIHATQRALLARARYDLGSAYSVRALLVWMAHDLSRLEEHDQTVSGFTRHLTDCFETIELLYSLGRSMNDLTQPAQFVQKMCDRVRSTLTFGYVGSCFAADERLGETVASRTFLSGQLTVNPDALRRTIDQSLAGSTDSRPRILNALDGKEVPGGGQVLLHPIWRAGKLAGAIFAGDKGGDDPQLSSYDMQLMEAAAGYVGAFLDNAVLYADQQALFLGTLDALTSSIDAKDRYTCGHSRRVAHLSTQLAVAAGFSHEQADRVRIAGLVHDVGKIGVPEAVLGKVGRLTDDEFDAIKKHPEMGHRILKDIPLLADVLPGVLSHHERWDGKGYPHGLAQEQIPEMARIIALADTFDAMSSTRSYRPAMPRPAVLAEIQRCAGQQFDPQLATIFANLDFTEYDQLVRSHAADHSEAVRKAAAE